MKLTLIGAGPGDPDLITLKGIKALQKAKVVLYDSLAHPSFGLLPGRLRQNPCWKTFGKTSCGQDDINELIVEKARQYGEVVRLKGGDSFIFGRGYEEIMFAAEHGIESEVIPGISSSYAVPALAGIPLTSRGVSESFWVITGTTRSTSFQRPLSRSTIDGYGRHFNGPPQTGRNCFHVFRVGQNGRILSRLSRTARLKTRSLLPVRSATFVPLSKVSEMASPAIIVIGKVAALPDLSYGKVQEMMQKQTSVNGFAD
jgi:uroporphyrin-III C-methyltransferase